MKWRPALAIGVVVAVLMVWLWSTRTLDLTNRGTRVNRAADGGDRAPSMLEPSHMAESGRQLATPDGLGDPIQIVDPDGAPIIGATVSLRVVPSADARPPADWPWFDEAIWRTATAERESDTQGLVNFSRERLNPAADVALWVTKPGFSAWSVLLHAGETLSAVPRPIVLATAMPILVRVVDSIGVPVAGASVVQRFALAESARAELDPDVLRAQYELARFALTDESGQVQIADLGGRQVIDAAHGSLRSGPWYGVAPSRVELELCSSFSWGGHVVRDASSVYSPDERVEVYAVGGGRKTRIDAGVVSSDGSFGPRTVAMTRSAVVEFELVGGTVVPTSVRRTAPVAGEHVDVEIAALTGFQFPVLVSTKSGAPLRGAGVTWSWSIEAGTQRFVRATGADGIAVLPAGSAGPILLQVEGKGFVSRQFQLTLSSDVVPAYPVVLSPGGSICGRVQHEGVPVENFTIVHRLVDGPEDLAAAEVADSKDGTFVLDGLPIGESAFFAMSHELPRSTEQRVPVTLSSRPALKFDLVSGGVGRGVVRDAATGEAILGARVQVWTMDGQTRIREFGPPAVTDASGQFKIGGLASGETSLLEASAEEYAATERLVRGVGSATQDVGVLALQSPRKLTVRLVLAPDSKPEEWSATVDTTRPMPSRKFPSSGVLEFSDLAIGGCRVTVERGTTEAETKFVVVTPDADAEIGFDVTGGMSLDVEVVAGEVDVDLSSCWLLIRGFAAEYELAGYRYLAVPGDGLVHVHRVQQDRLLLAVLDPNGVQLGSRRLVGNVISGGRVRIDLGPRLRTIRIVDAKHQPSVGLTVSAGRSSTGWLQTAFTNSNGEVQFEGLDDEWIDLHIQTTPSGGGVVRNIRLGDEINEIVFDARSSIAVRLRDGAEELPGVSIWLQDGFGAHAPFATISTDQDGLARSDRYVGQEYRGEVRQAGLWPSTFTLIAANPPVEKEVQVRRRGSVVLYAKRGGLPLAGVALHVESEEFETSATAWIASGAITASHAQCVTDGQGRLRLDGLPRGPYRWSIELDDGVQVGGAFDVEPQRRVDVDANVP